MQAASCSCSIMFLNCYFGEMATESFSKVADCMYESNWQLLQPELQKYIILFIGNAQRPLYYHGFNMAYVNLNTFMKVWMYYSILLIYLKVFLVFSSNSSLSKQFFHIIWRLRRPHHKAWRLYSVKFQDEETFWEKFHITKKVLTYFDSK